MSTLSKQCPPERIELKGILSEFRDALEEEIDKIKKSGQSSTLLYAGRRIDRPGSELWYRFSVEYVPALPADTPCKLLVGKDYFDVTVISFEENSIVISSKCPLPDTIGKARLENGATVLMERLIKCIEENAEKENVIGDRMLFPEKKGNSARKVFSYSDLKLSPNNTKSQNDAIISALTNNITYIWGPPGTGKTTVIGQIIEELYKHDRSVLVVSHTNTAVDGAIEKADKTYSKEQRESNAAYPILRLGVPARLLPERVLLSAHVEELGKELYEKKAELEKQQLELQQRINGILPLLAKDKWIKESKLEEIQEIIQTISLHEKRVDEIWQEIEAVNAAIQQEKSAHPEYSDYLSLTKAVETKNREYDSVSNKVQENEAVICGFPLRIQNANDEIKKHDKYAELRAQEEKSMSVQFFQNELAKIDGRISVHHAEIKQEETKRSAAQRVILEYENKNAVAKLFSSRSALAQAQKDLLDVESRLEQIDGELRRQQSLKQEYKQQLDDLLVLQEQIKSLIPSKTKDYWEEASRQLQKELNDAKDVQQSLLIQKRTLYEELTELEQKRSRAKVAFDVLDELERKLQQTQENLKKAKADIATKKTSCSERLERERLFCTEFFYNLTDNDITKVFDQLYALFKSVKIEIDSVDIAALQKEKGEADKRRIEILEELNALKQRMQELEKQAIMNARIVGATLAKSYLSETLRERKFDTVILDEASMAPIPALWCASYLAEANIVIVGDFLQLPPIVMAETPMAQKWLGKDVFFHSGMQERARDKATCPGYFVMLNDQFRMESDIADIANMYYGAYGGLCSHDMVEFRVNEREHFYTWYSGRRTKRNIHLIDTESLHAWVTGVPQGKSHSRLNCFSAAIDVDLAFKFLERRLSKIDRTLAEPAKEASVLIVAPYKPHVTRINQLIELEYRNRGFKENLNYIRAGTIHSFQGSEADIVIFDLVIDEPHWKANLFMTSKEVNDDLRKMFNVAITRAKFKLYVVGNFAYCQKRARNNALSELLDRLIKEERLVRVDAKELLPNITFTRKSDFSVDGNLTGKHIVCREESFNDYFMSDIQSFQKRLIIYSPFMTENRLSVLLPAFADAIKKGKQITVVTKAMSDRGKVERSQYQKCETELRSIGINILHKKGMHEKLIFVDSEAVWIGSLNALSFTGLTGEVMQRHADKELTAEYEKLFDIEHICGAIENAYEQKCPICGNEMIVKESAEGGIYWECIEGDYSRNSAQQYPADGILRCKCGAPYVFAMKNEPRWICTEDSKHFQKMREGDLKLEKMAALIPTKKARNEVNKYFAQKRKEWEASKKDVAFGKKSRE